MTERFFSFFFCALKGLFEVLEYVQDSKSTLFLALELVTGGELFDRIRNGNGTSEATAQRYFRQLIDGVAYCHSKVSRVPSLQVGSAFKAARATTLAPAAALCVFG
jgi:hypothetical protein